MPDYQDIELWPARIVAGDAIDEEYTLGDYPADEYTMSWALVQSGQTPIAWTGGADGETHTLQVAGATTADYPAGTWNIQCYVTDAGGERTTLAEGQIEIRADFAAADSTLQALSEAEQIRDAALATLKGIASMEQKTVTIEDRQVQFMGPDELRATIDWADRRIAVLKKQVDLRHGRGKSNLIRARFSD